MMHQGGVCVVFMLYMTRLSMKNFITHNYLRLPKFLQIPAADLGLLDVRVPAKWMNRGR